MTTTIQNQSQITPPEPLTGQQIKNALERQYHALREKINTLKLQNNRLTNPLLIKNTALNSLTYGQYGKHVTSMKELSENKIKHDQCRQLLRDIEIQYTQAPYSAQLGKEIVILNANFNVLVESNNTIIESLNIRCKQILNIKHSIETMRELKDLPNKDGYEFIGIDKSGNNHKCSIYKDENGIHRVTGIEYKELAGWNRIQNTQSQRR